MKKYEDTIRSVIAIIEDVQFDGRRANGFFEKSKILRIIKKIERTKPKDILQYHVARRLVQIYINKTRGILRMDELRNVIALQKHIDSIIEALDRLGYIAVILGAQNGSCHRSESHKCNIRIYI